MTHSTSSRRGVSKKCPVPLGASCFPAERAAEPALGGDEREKKTRGFDTYSSVTVTSAPSFLQLQDVLTGTGELQSRGQLLPSAEHPHASTLRLRRQHGRVPAPPAYPLYLCRCAQGRQQDTRGQEAVTP